MTSYPSGPWFGVSTMHAKFQTTPSSEEAKVYAKLRYSTLPPV
jgi:hypothetical protein